VTARRIVRLYPRAWRDRYETEFVELLGDRPIGFGEWIDIISGAIDARLSWNPRRAAASNAAAGGTDTMTVLDALRKRHCAGPKLTTRQTLAGAGALVAGSLASVGLKEWLRALGYPEAGDLATDLGFPITYVVVTNALWMRGQPWRARLVVSGVLVAIFALAAWIGRFI
jgi:hypothetical protein